MRKAPSKIDLHARLKKHAFEHAFITTYSFGTEFFEDYALDTFKAFQNNGNVSILIDEEEYQELIEAATQKSESFPKQANLRYLLHPVRVPGAFHPKIFLFASRQRGLLLLGSANFTLGGLGSAAEMVAAFSYEEAEDENALPLFQATLTFFEQVVERWPSEQLKSNLNTLKAEVPWLSKPSDHISKTDLPVLISNLDRPLWDQLLERFPNPARHLSVLSPFFDAKPTLLKHVLDTSGISKVTIYTQNGITTLTPPWLSVPEFKSGNLKVLFCSYSDEARPQNLHAKAYAFDCGRETVFAFGSANFTTPALRRTAQNGNLEVLLCYPPVAVQQGKVQTWFDPEETSIVVKAASELITAPESADERAATPNSFSVCLREAFVEDQSLKLKTDQDNIPNHAICSITQSNSRPFCLHIERAEGNTLWISLDPANQKRLHEAPAIAQLGIQSAEQWVLVSNPILISNLQDFVTGRDLRRERQLREALESPQRFMDVLTALSRCDDEERLKQFLTYCDIPIDLPVRLFKRKGSREDFTVEQLETFRLLGTRNLRHFEVLHDAVVDFIHRHRRRLDQHIERGTLKGIPNFLHILLTMGNLLLSQVERVIAGLNVETTVQMAPERWSQIRDNLDIYYFELGELLRLTAINYLDAMLKIAPAEKVQLEFGDDFTDLMQLYERATTNRDVLDTLQQLHLEIVTPVRRRTGPGFFNSMLAPDKWVRFLEKTRGLQRKLAQRIAA